MSEDPIQQQLERTRDERDVLANALSLLSQNFPHIAFDPMQPTAFVLAVAGMVNELEDKARTASAKLAALKIQHQADLKVMNERLTESIDRMLWRITQLRNELRNELRAEQSAQRKAKAQAAGVDLDAQPKEPAWIPHDGGPCPIKDEEVEEWQFKFRDGDTTHAQLTQPSEYIWEHCEEEDDIIAYRVLKWKPGFGPKAKAEPATFEAHGKTWTRHKPGDPMPCDPEALLEVLWQDDIDGIDSSDVQGAAKNWDWSNSGGKYNIIGWRYADEQPNTKEGQA